MMRDTWKPTEKFKKILMQQGEKGINKLAPFGIAFQRSKNAPDWFTVQVVGSKGEVLCTLDPYPIEPGFSLTIADISPAFAVKIK